MKKGFTLAELLIVLGITGITAAILLPAVNNLMPDKTKILYLKAYDELQQNIQSLASNSSLYPICLEQGDTTIGCQEHPLINTSKPLTKKFESYTGDTKLCKLLAFSMDAQESCKDESFTYNNSTFKSNLSFTTKNGMQWIVSPQARIIESDKATYQSDIYVDVDPSKKSKNCLYDSVNCKEPDRFKFLVAADGSVFPADPMGLMYVNTRKSYMKNKKQKAQGEVAALLTDELREFGYRPCEEGSGNGGSQGGDGSGDGGGSGEGEGGGTDRNVVYYHCGDSYKGKVINCGRIRINKNNEYRDSSGKTLFLYDTIEISWDKPPAKTHTITSDWQYYEPKYSWHRGMGSYHKLTVSPNIKTQTYNILNNAVIERAKYQVNHIDPNSYLCFRFIHFLDNSQAMEDSTYFYYLNVSDYDPFTESNFKDCFSFDFGSRDWSQYNKN